MDYVEDKYIRFLNTRLDKFKNVKSGLYNFRCPYCGDSQKHRNKARGYFFLKKSEYIFKCHNCGMGRSLGNFLKDQAPDLYDQFVLEKYRAGATGKGRHTPDYKPKSAKPNFSSKVSDLQSIADLNKKHAAREYLEKRQIPQESYPLCITLKDSRLGLILRNLVPFRVFKMIEDVSLSLL